MKSESIHFISQKDCVFTHQGQNLAAMRRAELLRIAKSLEVEVNGEMSKNDVLGKLIARLKSLEVQEVTELL